MACSAAIKSESEEIEERWRRRHFGKGRVIAHHHLALSAPRRVSSSSLVWYSGVPRVASADLMTIFSGTGPGPAAAAFEEAAFPSSILFSLVRPSVAFTRA